MFSQLKVDTWRHPSSSPIYSMCAANPPWSRRQGGQPCVALSTAGEEVSVWDLSGGQMRSSLRVGTDHSSLADQVVRQPAERLGGGDYGMDSFASDAELAGAYGAAAAGGGGTGPPVRLSLPSLWI